MPNSKRRLKLLPFFKASFHIYHWKNRHVVSFCSWHGYCWYFTFDLPLHYACSSDALVLAFSLPGVKYLNDVVTSAWPNSLLKFPGQLIAKKLLFWPLSSGFATQFILLQDAEFWKRFQPVIFIDSVLGLKFNTFYCLLSFISTPPPGAKFMDPKLFWNNIQER